MSFIKKPFNVVRAIFNTKFVTAINCMDGRAVHAVYWYFVLNYGIKFVDSVTDAGMVKRCEDNKEACADIRYKVVEVSAGKHSSNIVAVVAHAECAGNPIDDATQKAQAVRYAQIVRGWFSDESDMTVLPLWVAKNARGRWSVEELTSKETELLEQHDRSLAAAM